MATHNNNGFTVMELLMALGIFGLLIVTASYILITSLRSNDIIWEQLLTQNEGRQSLQEVVDDVRRAETSSIGSYLIESATSSSLVFFANIDADTPRERIRYFLEDEMLKKGITNPSGTPLAYVTSTEEIRTIATSVKNASQDSPVFEYFDQDYTGTQAALIQPVSLTAIRVVRIQLELEKDPTQTPVPLHVESTVQIRNLKDE